ncbi:MAG: ferrochelatase [Alphaproteobacteria bacterium]
MTYNKIAVVLLNLGGPDGLNAVRPFLFNLFNDPAIIGAPGLIRWLLAQRISRKRAPVAREIYRQLGGSSPLLANTQSQSAALSAKLGAKYRTFIAMRYWHPRAADVAGEVANWGADRVVLLPLYPQFSTTTSGSSVAEWTRAAQRAGLDAPSVAVCCYPAEPGFIEAIAAAAKPMIAAAGGKPYRVLFSAHGLPKRIIERGDPYQAQVERTGAAAAQALELADDQWVICYQSRVGPLEWIGPSTDDEIARAGRDKVATVIVPIAFVSEHSETLVELDIEYRALAEAEGVPGYYRASTVGADDAFIEGLAGLVRAASKSGSGWRPGDGSITCSAASGRCPVMGPR